MSSSNWTQIRLNDYHWKYYADKVLNNDEYHEALNDTAESWARYSQIIKDRATNFESEREQARMKVLMKEEEERKNNPEKMAAYWRDKRNSNYQWNYYAKYVLTDDEYVECSQDNLDSWKKCQDLLDLKIKTTPKKVIDFKKKIERLNKSIEENNSNYDFDYNFKFIAASEIGVTLEVTDKPRWWRSAKSNQNPEIKKYYVYPQNSKLYYCNHKGKHKRLYYEYGDKFFKLYHSLHQLFEDP